MEDTLKKQQRTKGDPFLSLGVSKEDKILYFLVKWVFNAIKRDSPEDDPDFKGNSYISKNDMTKQLFKNPELMDALNIKD